MAKGFTAYILHTERQRRYEEALEALKKTRHPLAKELSALALLGTRTEQYLAAACALTGRTVRVYDVSGLSGIIRHCVVSLSGATHCFTLSEPSLFGVLQNSVAVSPATRLFVENSYG